jgi:hypothetical protein
MNTIAFHAINFFLLIGLLTFLLRDKVKDASLTARLASGRTSTLQTVSARKHSSVLRISSLVLMGLRQS